MKKPSKTDREIGHSDGYCCLEVRYPNNEQYMAGYSSGFKFAESEYYERDSLGSNEAHEDSLSC